MSLSDLVDGIVHEPTQIREGAIDLTTAEVYEVEAPGRVDFGGGELAEADLAPHERTWRNDDDDYGWWHLDAGVYLIEYNESLSGDERVRVQTRTEVAARGAFHPTLAVDELPRMPLTVGDGGIRLKENARISTLLAR